LAPCPRTSGYATRYPSAWRAYVQLWSRQPRGMAHGALVERPSDHARPVGEGTAFNSTTRAWPCCSVARPDGSNGNAKPGDAGLHAFAGSGAVGTGGQAGQCHRHQSRAARGVPTATFLPRRCTLFECQSIGGNRCQRAIELVQRARLPDPTVPSEREAVCLTLDAIPAPYPDLRQPPRKAGKLIALPVLGGISTTTAGQRNSGLPSKHESMLRWIDATPPTRSVVDAGLPMPPSVGAKCQPWPTKFGWSPQILRLCSIQQPRGRSGFHGVRALARPRPSPHRSIPREFQSIVEQADECQPEESIALRYSLA
jgi:hypothetical protein